MRPSKILRLCAVAFVAVLVLGQTAVANDDEDTTLAEKAAARLPQPVKVGSLICRAVLEPIESQPILGYVKSVVRSSDGAIRVVVDFGGLWGFGSRPIAVPVEAMVLLGQYMEIVDLPPDQLKTFPTFDAVGTDPLPSSQIIKVGLAKPSH